MGNEPSKKSSSRKSGDGASKSTGSSMGPLEALSSSLCELCSPVLNHDSQKADVDSTADPSSGKHKTGRSNHQQTTSRSKTRQTTNVTSHPDKSDRSIKTSIKNVQLDVTGLKAVEKKRVIPTDESAHTFAASLASSNHLRKGNDYVMITDALSDVRVK